MNSAVAPKVHQPAAPVFDPVTYGVCTAFMGMSLFLFVETNILVFTYFKRYRGLYFWSLLITSWGVTIQVLGDITRWFAGSYPWVLDTIMLNLGLDMYIFGQTLILYSRLHLVCRNYNLLRSILVMIIIVFFFFGLPLWITAWPSRLPQTKKTWAPVQDRYERIQSIIFLVMESTISIIYVWATVRLIKPNENIKVRRVMWELIGLNFLLVSLDVIWMTLFFLNYNGVKVPMQQFSYALKVRVEFVVLNQLKGLTSRPGKQVLNYGRRYSLAAGTKSGVKTSGGVGGIQVNQQSTTSQTSSAIQPATTSGPRSAPNWSFPFGTQGSSTSAPQETSRNHGWRGTTGAVGTN